jgi:hypothetical protein
VRDTTNDEMNYLSALFKERIYKQWPNASKVIANMAKNTLIS